MKKRIKLLKKWKSNSGDEYDAGKLLEVDENTFKSLTEGDEPIAKEWDDEAEKAEKKAKEEEDQRVKSLVGSAVKDVIEEVNAKNSDLKMSITLHDKSDDDPVGGYLPQKNNDKYSKDEVEYAFGLFSLDVKAAEKGKESERLVKARERSSIMVQKGVKDGMIKAAGDGLSTSVESEGAYLLPTEMSTALTVGALEQSKVRPRATRMNMTTRTLAVPYVEDNDHSAGTVYGGVQAYWTGEEDQLTESKPKIGKNEFTLHKLTALGFVSGEMIKWSPSSVGSWLFPIFQNAIAWKEDGAFITGDGTGKPLGILSAPNLLTIAAEGGQAASTIVTANVLNLFARHKEQSSSSTMFIANKTTFPQLSQLTITVGTGGTVLWQPANGLAGQPNQSLMGYVLDYSERVPTLGTVGDLILADLSRYVISDDRVGPELAQSIHLKFDYDQMAFRLIKYTGGQPADKKVFTPENGDTLSPFVVIATRS